MASLLALLLKQDELQRETYGHDFAPPAQIDLENGQLTALRPTGMTDTERMDYIRINVLALEDELHEALAETGWKPWASSQHVNLDRYLGEMADAFHFFMNLLLATGVPPERLADRFTEVYLAKWQRNVDRQREGYTGVKEKCPACKRDTAETQLTETSDLATGIFTTRCVCGETLWTSDQPA